MYTLMRTLKHVTMSQDLQLNARHCCFKDAKYAFKTSSSVLKTTLHTDLRSNCNTHFVE